MVHERSMLIAKGTGQKLHAWSATLLRKQRLRVNSDSELHLDYTILIEGKVGAHLTNALAGFRWVL